MPSDERSHISKSIPKKDGVPPFSKKDINDSNIESVTEDIENHLKSDKAPKYKIDLSENQLSDEGIIKLISWLSNFKWVSNCVELRLHRNQIADSGAAALGKFLTNPKNKLEALHLSHNKIGTNGVMDILYGLSDAKIGGKFAYPRIDESGEHITPLWLRLERNETPNLDESLIEWRNHVIKTRGYGEEYQPICTIPKRCRPHRCERGKKTPPPLCHLNITCSKSKIQLDKIPMYVTSIPHPKTEHVNTQDPPEISVTSESSDPDASSPKKAQDKENKISSENNKQEKESFVGENLPFYILMDISAVLEMLELRNNDMIYPFSLPGLLALCNSGLMNYINVEDNNPNSTKIDDSERIVLIFVKNIFKELNNMSYKRSFVMKKFEEARDSFIAPLMKYTVIELLQGCEDLNFKSLSPMALSQARDFNLSDETISTIQFAFVWAKNLYEVAKVSKTEQKRPINCIFLTANPAVKAFFHSLKSHEQLSTEDSTNLYCQLPCITTEQMNRLLQSHFPTLQDAVLKPGILRNNNTPSALSPNAILKASTLIPLLDEYLQSQSDQINLISSTNSTIYNQSMNVNITHPSHTSVAPTNQRPNSLHLTSSTKTSQFDAPISSPLPNRTSSTSLNNLLPSTSGENIHNSHFYPLHSPSSNFFIQKYDDTSASSISAYSSPSYSMNYPPHTFNNVNSQSIANLYNSQSTQVHFQSSLSNDISKPSTHLNYSSTHPTFPSAHLGTGFGDSANLPSNSQTSFPTYPLQSNPTTKSRISPPDNTPIFSKVPAASRIHNEANPSPLSIEVQNNSFNHPGLEFPFSSGFPASQSRGAHLDILRSELIGAISIVDELSNRLRIMGNQMPMYAEDCLSRAKTHILRWSTLLSVYSSDIESQPNNQSNGNI